MARSARETQMAYDQNNIFAKILRGDIPCVKVYEDDHTLAFMDVMPQAKATHWSSPRSRRKTSWTCRPKGRQR